MTICFSKIPKAAAQTAAFYFCLLLFIFCGFTVPVNAKSAKENGLEIVKKKAVNLLMQKQKKQAITTIDDFIAAEGKSAAAKEAREFRINIAKKFLTKEAQEAYEMSLNETLESPKDSRKLNEECLTQEPENLDCLIQRARLIYREKPKKLLPTEEIEKTAKFFDVNELNWVKASTEKSLPEFKNYNFYKKDSGKLSEEQFVLAALEMDRAILVKNFSKAKEVLARLENDYSDWPDLVYFKDRIDFESSENKDLTPTEITTQYQNKCKSLSKSVVRKYRYDFDLCLRGF